MYELRLKWKEVFVNLSNLDSHLRASHSTFLGSQANRELILYFSDELSAEAEQTIRNHWESLDGSDYKSSEQIQAEKVELAEAIRVTKEGMISKSWDQLSTVERKIMMGLEVSREEMGL